MSWKSFILFAALSLQSTGNYLVYLREAPEWGEFYVPEGHVGYEIEVAVPFGLIGAIISYDPSTPGEVTVSGKATGIAQGYRFYIVDHPDSEDRIQFTSNLGDDEPSFTFTITSGETQYLTWEDDYRDFFPDEEPYESGWLQLEYLAETGFRLIDQGSPNLYVREPTIKIVDDMIHVIPNGNSSVIQQSTDLINWTDIIADGSTAKVPIGTTPVYFRERCPWRGNRENIGG